MQINYARPKDSPATASRIIESKKRVVGRIAPGIAWVVSEARNDKRTGFVGESVPCSAYVEKTYEGMMHKWL